MLTAQFSSGAYREQKAFDWESKILDRRIETMERMARLIARQPGIQDEWSRYQSYNRTGDSNDSPPRESSQMLADYNAEYLNVLLLAKLYFGKKTIDAVNSLSIIKGPWWMKPQDKQFDVLGAMSVEFTASLPGIESTLHKF